jgi:hypothetical protein
MLGLRGARRRGSETSAADPAARTRKAAMHPVTAVIHLNELRRRETVAEAAHERLCARASRHHRVARSAAMPVALALALALVVIAALVIAASDPIAVARTIAGG